MENAFAIDKLMAETRQLAADYYRTTQQTLPVSSELAKYDASRLLGLRAPDTPVAGIDAIDKNQQCVQIKGRVIFKEGKAGYRLGQINHEGNWQRIILVLMNPEYSPVEIYAATREEIEAALTDADNDGRRRRGAMSVAKFKIIGELVWTQENGLEEN